MFSKGSAVHEYVVGMRIIVLSPVSLSGLYAKIITLGEDDPHHLVAKVSLGVLRVISHVSYYVNIILYYIEKKFSKLGTYPSIYFLISTYLYCAGINTLKFINILRWMTGWLPSLENFLLIIDLHTLPTIAVI